MGTYAELLSSSSIFAQLLEDINQHEQEQHSVALLNQRSMVGSISSEKDDQEDECMNLRGKNIETKQEGTVKWNVYVSYIQAGVGVIFGFLIIVFVFSAQQVTSIYSNWWLAAWSNDESRRYQNSTNCMNTRDKITDDIQRMSDAEWNTYRNRQYYLFCGELIDDILVVLRCSCILFYSSCSCTLLFRISSHCCFPTYMFKCCTSTS